MISPEKPIVGVSVMYTSGQAAKRLGCHRNTLIGYARTNKVRAHRFANGDYAFQGVDLLRLWASKYRRTI